ncbi:MAG: LPS assembly protein LptD, partial [Pseudomonadota bacterium]
MAQQNSVLLRIDPRLLTPPTSYSKQAEAEPAPAPRESAASRKSPLPLTPALPEVSRAVPQRADSSPVPSPVPSPVATLAPAAQSIALPDVQPTDAEHSLSSNEPVLRLATELKTELKTAPASAAEADAEQTIFISARSLSGLTDQETIAEGDAELRKVGMQANADRITYWPLEDTLEAVGQATLRQGGDVLSGPKIRLQVDRQVGFVETPEYTLKRGMAPSATPGKMPPRVTEAHGRAQRIDFEGVNQIRISGGTYSTCKPTQDDWYTQTDELKLDYDRGVGEGKNAVVYFKDVPVLYTPWLSFSLNNQRKSGFLAPTFGSTSTSGAELSAPYYWNIAPNHDATFTPRILSKRGTQLNTELRYLDTQYMGTVQAEILPNDQLTQKDRYAYALQHQQTLGTGLTGKIDYRRVSDDHYYTDLASRLSTTSQTAINIFTKKTH